MHHNQKHRKPVTQNRLTRGVKVCNAADEEERDGKMVGGFNNASIDSGSGSGSASFTWTVRKQKTSAK